jgi:hypothetical protein
MLWGADGADVPEQDGDEDGDAGQEHGAEGRDGGQPRSEGLLGRREQPPGGTRRQVLGCADAGGEAVVRGPHRVGQDTFGAWSANSRIGDF